MPATFPAFTSTPHPLRCFCRHHSVLYSYRPRYQPEHPLFYSIGCHAVGSTFQDIPHGLGASSITTISALPSPFWSFKDFFCLAADLMAELEGRLYGCSFLYVDERESCPTKQYDHLVSASTLYRTINTMSFMMEPAMERDERSRERAVSENCAAVHDRRHQQIGKFLSRSECSLNGFLGPLPTPWGGFPRYRWGRDWRKHRQPPQNQPTHSTYAARYPPTGTQAIHTVYPIYPTNAPHKI